MADPGDGRTAATRRVGPVEVLAARYPEALAAAARLIGRPGGAVLAFANAHSVNLARRDPAFAAAMTRALVLNDGVGLDIAGRLLHGARFPANLNGTDFTPALLAHAAPARVFVLGGAPGVAARAAAALAKRYPHHVFAGTRDGFFAPGDAAAAVADEVRAARPDIVLVGMGQPRQELWAAAMLGRTDALLMCIGAFLDFTAGVVPRAPAWVRAARVEWAYRLALEPRRLAGRYLVGNVRFLLDVVRDRRRARRG